MRAIITAACVCIFGLSTGCARYEYNLVKPADQSQHIDTKSPVRFTNDNIEYVLQTSSNRLVMQIYNRGHETVKLMGNDSYIIDPRGESHPLAERMIPPASFIKLIMPPAPKQMRSNSSSISFGVGGGFSHAYYGRGYYGRGFYDPDFHDSGPYYYTVYDPNDANFWEWEGETDARLLLTFEREKHRIVHEFQFHRVKM